MSSEFIIEANPSKSHFQRVLICSALSGKICRIFNYPKSEDAQTSINSLREMGFSIIEKDEFLIINSEPRIFRELYEIDCRESGFMLRTLPLIAAASGGNYIFRFSEIFVNRNLTEFENIFNQFGTKLNFQNDNLTFNCNKSTITSIRTDGSISSQYLSGLLISMAFFNSLQKIEVANLQSKKYTDLTLNILDKFGHHIIYEDYHNFHLIKSNKNTDKFIKQDISDLIIEGDWSGMSFPIVLAAVNGKAQINGLDINSVQPDRIIIDILRNCGTEIEFMKDYLSVEKNQLHGFEFDAADNPDLVPALIPLALKCNGKSVIKNVDRLKYKESNRLEELVRTYSDLGGKIEYSDNKIVLFQSDLKSGKVKSMNDHRLIMSYQTAELMFDIKIEIDGLEAVNKSYPNFFEDIKKVQIYE